MIYSIFSTHQINICHVSKMLQYNYIWLLIILIIFIICRTNRNTTKYIMIKGVQGFGDRLQCLLEAIRISRETNRILVVDYQDKQWANNPEYDFEYFFIVDKSIKTITKKELQKETITTIYPYGWNQYNLFQNNLNLTSDNFKIDRSDNPDWFKFKIEQVIVHNGLGDRMWNWDDINLLKLRPNILEVVKTKFEELGIYNKKYIAIHLRGTDKPQDNKKTYVDDILKKVSLTLSEDPDKIVLLTDDVLLLNEFTEKFKKQFVSSNKFLEEPECFVNIDKGIHNLSNDDILCSKIEKKDLLIDSIIDFIILNQSNLLISDGNSVFSNMSRDFKDYTKDGIFGFKNTKEGGKTDLSISENISVK